MIIIHSIYVLTVCVPATKLAIQTPRKQPAGRMQATQPAHTPPPLASAHLASAHLASVPCPADSFSFGIVLWEIVTHEVPRRGFVQLPPPSEACPAGVSQLIRDCLQTDPRQRPSAVEIVEGLRAM